MNIPHGDQTATSPSLTQGKTFRKPPSYWIHFTRSWQAVTSRQ